MIPDSVSIVIGWVGTAISGSAAAIRGITIATLSMAEVLTKLISEHVADDISVWKNALLRREVGKTAIVEADAQKRAAEAAEACNKATLHKRKDHIARLEREKLELANAKTKAEIKAIEADANTKRVQAIMDGKVRLIDALSQVKQEGGAVFFSQENLTRILAAGIPPDSISDAEKALVIKLARRNADVHQSLKPTETKTNQPPKSA